MVPRKIYKFCRRIEESRKRESAGRLPPRCNRTIACRWTMFAISTIFRLNTIYCNTIQHRLHRALGERNSFDRVSGDESDAARRTRLGISHVINLLRYVWIALSFRSTVGRKYAVLFNMHKNGFHYCILGHNKRGRVQMVTSANFNKLLFPFLNQVHIYYLIKSFYNIRSGKLTLYGYESTSYFRGLWT